MNPLIQLKQTTSVFLIAFGLACFGLSPMARALLPPPPPGGGYPGANTALGDSALFNLTTGGSNTAIGADALVSNTGGSSNTAVGVQALDSNTTGNSNTAIGVAALVINTTGRENTAIGVDTLLANTTGNDNVACGFEALFHNTTGIQNTATGSFALIQNTTGQFNTANGAGALQANIGGTANTATGESALSDNTSGNNNTANGINALFFNTTGDDNTAVGENALLNNNTGSNNIALGVSAGSNLTNGSNNIEISAPGMAGEANKIRIGRQGTQNGTFIAGIFGVAVTGSQVVVNSNGKLGVAASSARFKEAIKPMDKASEAILALKPVTFHYKKEIDQTGTSQFGLVAEEVEKVNPDLVVCDEQGKPYSVRYDAVNAMLLNEFLKQHGTVQELKSTVAKLEATILQRKKDFQTIAGQQQKQIDALSAGLQKVSAQLAAASPSGGGLEASKPAPQVVKNP